MKRISSMTLGACLWAAGCSDSPLAPTAAPETSEQNATPKVAFNTAPSQTSASVTTDKEDYQPGDTVVITGTGWAADETVDLVIDEDPATHSPHSFTSVADAAGSFANTDFVVDEHDLGVTFTLTATGLSSGETAQWVFYDGTLQMTGAAPSPFSPNQASSAGLKDNSTVDVCNQGSATNNVKVRIRQGLLGGSPGSQTLVREILVGNLAASSPPGQCNITAAVVWDGKNTGGSFVADGAYTARVTDAAAASTEDNGSPRKREIIVDNTNPTGAVDAIAGGTVGSPQSITGTAGDAAYTSGSVVSAAVVSVSVEIRRVSDNALLASGAATSTGTSFSTWSFNYTPTEASAQRATAKATDRADNTTTSSPANFTVTALNQAPTADAGGPYSGNEGSAIMLNGGGSSDSDGTIAGYQWSLGTFTTPSTGSCSFVSGTSTGVSPSVICTDNGSLTVSLTVTDDDGAASTPAQATVTVGNVAPTATFSAESPVDEGSSFLLELTSPLDPSSVDTAAGLQYAFDCGDGSGYNALSATTSRSCPTNDDGTRSVKGKIQDKDGGFTEYTASVTVDNVAPTATFNAPSPVNEGTSIALSLTDPFDPSSADVAAGLQYAFDCGDGGGYNAFGATSSRSCTTNDNGTRSVKGKIKDKDGGSTEYTASVTIDNVAPSVGAITGAPTDPIALGTAINVCTPFSDPGTADTHTGTIDFNQNLFNGGASIVKTATISFNTTTGNGQACASHTYAAAGVYAVKARVEDDDLGAGESPVYEYVVVYDPSAGFVTGGGWIWSPAGAYAADPGLEGKANFGFVSKYKKGVTVPEGQTQFQFHAGNLNFHSTSYDWLVVAGARAQYKGYGTINGTAGYGFLLTAIDGQVNGGGGTDKFRIKIWDGSGVVYDNQMGASDDSNASTALGGGSIVIHSPKK